MNCFVKTGKQLPGVYILMTGKKETEYIQVHYLCHWRGRQTQLFYVQIYILYWHTCISIDEAGNAQPPHLAMQWCYDTWWRKDLALPVHCKKLTQVPSGLPLHWRLFFASHYTFNNVKNHNQHNVSDSLQAFLALKSIIGHVTVMKVIIDFEIGGQKVQFHNNIKFM
mgnify:CR=1 FL=1